MKIKDIMSIIAVALMAVGCSSDDGLQPKQGRVPITLTASVGTEVTTRGVQETALASGETVYVWGKEGSGNYDYLQAWTLTAGADGALSGSAKYYPLSGETLTMVALHGNFSYTEGDALPASISHSVELDQSSTGNYEKSDLLWATVSGSSADATGKNLAFTHMLSKIEIKLHPGEGYSDISSAEVKLRGVLPTITINPTDGTLGSASGSATLITPRLTVDNLSDATTPYALYEAIIPPQAAPVDFLNIKIGDKIATVAADVATFASNKRYFYDITISEFKVNVTSSITSWGSGVNADVTQNKTVLIGRPKLPIEYVAQYNLASPTSFAADNKAISSMYFSWNNSSATTGGAASGPKSDIAKMIKGTAISGYHLPSGSEWFAILPNRNYGEGLVENNEETVAWGVTNNNGTYIYDVNRAFFNDYYFPSGTIGYGLRFKETAGNDSYKNGIYTCAYRYQFQSNDPAVDDGSHQCASLTIKVKYVGPNQNTTISTISDETWWASPDFTVVLPACGFGTRNIADNRDPGFFVTLGRPATGWYWGANSISNDNAACIDFQDYRVVGSRGDEPGFPFPIRLFKDVATP